MTNRSRFIFNWVAGLGILAGAVFGGPAAPEAHAEAPQVPQAPAQYNLYLPLVVSSGPVASAQDLIAEASAAGQIDYPTSLLYRAYAQYGEDGLPAAFRGGISGEDNSLFVEIEAALPTLPPATQALFAGFLVRPDDPDSVVNGPLPIPTAEQGLAAGAGAPLSATAGFQCTAIDPEGTAWGSVASATIPVRVHSLCFNNPGLDATHTLPLVQLTLSTLESLWGPMTQFMGISPLSDASVADDGGDGLIDFYIMYDQEIYPRGESSLRFNGIENGFARPLRPRQGVAAPGLVILRLLRVADVAGDTSGFRTTIAHELFHLLQFARNEQFMYQDHASYWFVEASAVWAGWNFVPDGRQHAHDRFHVFQPSELQLHAAGPVGTEAHQHTYASYIWPFFMHQQVNSYTIKLAWQDIAGVSTWAQADAVLNNWVNFDTNFPLFALRNLNDKTRFGAAINGHYVDFDPQFPDGQAPPTIEVDGYVVLGDSQAENVTLPSLKARYFHYRVDPDVQQLEVDVSDFEPADHFKAQMVARLRGQGWKIIPLPSGSPMRFCMDDPDQDIEEFYLVLSNSDMPIANSLEGTYTITDLAQPCACEDFSNIDFFTGTISFSYTKTAENARYQFAINEAASVSFTMDVGSSGPGGISYIGFLGGSGSVNDTLVEKGNPPDVYNMTASSAPVNGATPYDLSRAYLNFKFSDCSYNFGTVPYINAPIGGHPRAYEVASVRSGDRPVPLPISTLSGSEGFRSHSIDWGLANYGDAFFSGGYGQTMFDLNVVNDNNAGDVLVTWSLTPVFAP